MNILIVSYVDSITTSIKEVIKRSNKGTSIDVVRGTSKAYYLVGVSQYDLIIIDMMVQEYSDTFTKPLLQPAMDFLKNLKLEYPNTKAFVLFDEVETGEKGQAEVLELGYAIANFDFSSNEWEKKLLEYI